MKVLIFEDERLTAERLVLLLKRYDPEIEVIDVLETVKQGVNWFKNNPDPELIFMDIHLTDGSCFELFAELKIEVPIIFTTAYDKYAIQAFKVNSVDYLLKPIDFEELEAAIQKFENSRGKQTVDQELYKTILQKMMKSYKQRFLVKKGEQLIYLKTQDIAYFIYDDGLVFAYTNSAKRYVIDHTIQQLEDMLDPEQFYRLNRKIIVQLNAIAQIHKFFNGRLLIKTDPAIDQEITVSRDKVADFKKWLDQ